MCSGGKEFLSFHSRAEYKFHTTDINYVLNYLIATDSLIRRSYPRVRRALQGCSKITVNYARDCGIYYTPTEKRKIREKERARQFQFAMRCEYSH